MWHVNLDPVAGHEQAGRRPCLVISDDRYNYGQAGLVAIVPLTRIRRPNPFHVPISPPEGGITSASFILCDQIRTVSIDERFADKWGDVSPATLHTVEDRIKVFLKLR
ncbi:MAG: growth inhibitor PemK [Chloroflexi bacterium]|nr:MAG: growth inhibitor PemK [Chloroflexota bacterium]